MSYIRSYLPNYMGNILGYYYGRAVQITQPYLASSFTIENIVDNIYLGNISTSVYSDKLEQNGITHILSLINGSYSMFPDKFIYKHIHINDDPWLSIDKYFDECIEFIEQSQQCNGKILIHCMCGISRSTTIIAAYLIKKYKMSHTNAILYLKNKNKFINPNDGFTLQLNRYEKNFKLF